MGRRNVKYNVYALHGSENFCDRPVRDGEETGSQIEHAKIELIKNASLNLDDSYSALFTGYSGYGLNQLDITTPKRTRQALKRCICTGYRTKRDPELILTEYFVAYSNALARALVGVPPNPVFVNNG